MSAPLANEEISSIRLKSGKGGPCRVFIIQTRNQAEVTLARELFSDLCKYCSVRTLVEGVTTAFAVQGHDQRLLGELELVLKEQFKFSMVYSGFNDVIHRVVQDLALETDSRLVPLPVCRSCGSPDPFPSRLTLRGAGGRATARAVFCERCLASIAAGEHEAEEFCRLVQGELKATAATEVVRERGLVRKGVGRRPGASSRIRRDEPRNSPAMNEDIRLAG